MTMAQEAVGRRDRRNRSDLSPLVDYRLVAKIFHWATAALVFAMFACGVVMTQLGGGPVADFLFSAHKLTGVGILVLVIARWVYRIMTHMAGQWRRQTGHHRIHGLLYGCLVLTPLLGWAGVSDFGAREAFGVTLPAIWPEGAGYSHLLLSTHAYVAFAMLALVCIHIGVALQDYIMRRSDAETGPSRS